MAIATRRRIAAGDLGEKEFNEWIERRLRAYREHLDKLAAAQRAGELGAKRVRVKEYKVRAYRVQSHWRIIPTIITKKG